MINELLQMPESPHTSLKAFRSHGALVDCVRESDLRHGAKRIAFVCYHNRWSFTGVNFAGVGTGPKDGFDTQSDSSRCTGVSPRLGIGVLQVSVLEMDGSFDKLEELIYVESHLSNTSSKFYGEITQQMLKNSTFPGSTNGTGLFQTIVGLKIREVYEAITKKEVVPAA